MSDPIDADPASELPLEILARYLEADGWKARRLAGRDAFAMNVAVAGAEIRCLAQLRADAEQLICYAIAPFSAPAERRPAVAECVTRANYGL